MTWALNQVVGATDTTVNWGPRVRFDEQIFRREDDDVDPHVAHALQTALHHLDGALAARQFQFSFASARARVADAGGSSENPWSYRIDREWMGRRQRAIVARQAPPCPFPTGRRSADCPPRAARPPSVPSPLRGSRAPRRRRSSRPSETALLLPPPRGARRLP